MKLFKSLLIGSALISQSFATTSQKIEFDSFGRLTHYPGKIETPCPKQTEKTAVLFVIGQSNSANHAEKKFKTKHLNKVFNYYNGKCYIATSPLLGATNTNGEFITPLADKLIENGDYESVVIVSSGIGGTPIRLWQKGGVLNDMMLNVLYELHSKFVITEIIWHQGEQDFFEKTPSEQYKKSFNSLVKSIRIPGTYNAPIYYAIATKCGNNQNWTANNPVAEAQRNLANNSTNVYLGADTDSLLLSKDRLHDQCHFSATGQLKTANAYALAIHQHRIVK